MMFPFVDGQIRLIDLDLEEIFSAGEMKCSGLGQRTGALLEQVCNVV